ncbi:MAG: epimerase [Algoriphagus sp.]|jgi:nucleoside-diphosphate-sugar epimerase|uniref:epimerase n=1 Tax=Algoriphagus sp. TaxID=1872435 RepID=UPI00275A4979|nr:epimerase [Algoriphagus sp.]MDP4748134.1 epimerase [Algoriphagus sp.]MDP4838014.1 epimerase [Algoriphagus sp.]MDP4904200.1 epimerase [Algoriphagus sp.]MDP4956118.1 epimerase [Algoriphagus sp.]
MKQVSIIGLGWLGEAAGLLLQKQGYSVLGSTTRLEKVGLLRNKGLDAVYFALDPNPKGTAYAQLFDSEILVVTLPPRSRKGDGEVYLQQLVSLRGLVEKSAVRQVIFISSTGIYPNISKAEPYTEEEEISESKAGNAILLQAEALMGNSSKYDLTILRMGGLMGVDRIPGVYFSGKEQVVGHTRVNFIHQVDAAGIIVWAINQGLWNQTFNGVAPEHPLRREVYQHNASTLGIPLPASFQNAADEEVGRLISSEKIISTGFTFEYPDPLTFSYATRL